MRLLAQLGLLFGISVYAAQAFFDQVPLMHERQFEHGLSGSYDEGLFRPIETLDMLSESNFTTMGHPLFPNYGVRIKQSSFCDATVK